MDSVGEEISSFSQAVEYASGPPPQATTTSSRTLADLFDNEGLWNAEDSDEYILAIAGEVETALRVSLIDMADAGGNSLLHMAAIWNRPKIMEALIRRGVELNNKNTSGQTPLDLATHYGNVDLALQLRHYGGKHSCESERDLAIAQRDLAQRQLKDVESDLSDVQGQLKMAKQNREEIRIERDLLVEDKQSVLLERDDLLAKTASLRQQVDSLKSDYHEVLLELSQVREALVCESNARLVAVEGWRSAQASIDELQERESRFREREEEMIRLRDEAKSDLDVARERTRLAELDQGKAYQAQLEAERERDIAVKKQLDAENSVASERYLWAKRIAKTERDRKNIQIEIDRQTETLRKECNRLEKALHSESSVVWSLQEELNGQSSLVERLNRKLSVNRERLQSVESMNKQLEQKVAELEEAQRSYHKTWCDRLEQSLREAAHENLRRIVSSVVSAAESVVAQTNELRRLSESCRCAFQMRPEVTHSLFSDNMLATSLSCSLLQKPSSLLPLLPDHGGNSPGRESSRPQLVPVSQTGKIGMVTDSFESPGGSTEPNFDLSFFCDPNAAASVVTTARAALHLPIDQLHCSVVADLVSNLSAAFHEHVENVSAYVSRNWRFFRKHIQALEKMVERKDELIARFNQHRRDKPKKQSAQLRECLYKPIV